STAAPELKLRNEIIVLVGVPDQHSGLVTYQSTKGLDLDEMIACATGVRFGREGDCARVAGDELAGRDLPIAGDFRPFRTEIRRICSLEIIDHDDAGFVLTAYASRVVFLWHGQSPAVLVVYEQFAVHFAFELDIDARGNCGG